MNVQLANGYYGTSEFTRLGSMGQCNSVLDLIWVKSDRLWENNHSQYHFSVDHSLRIEGMSDHSCVDLTILGPEGRTQTELVNTTMTAQCFKGTKHFESKQSDIRAIWEQAWETIQQQESSQQFTSIDQVEVLVEEAFLKCIHLVDANF